MATQKTDKTNSKKRDKEPESLKKKGDKKQDKTSAKKQKAKAEPKEKKTPGRKPWVPDYQFIEDQARNGLNDKQIAALCNIDHRRFCMKKGELSELVEALERGRAKGTSMAATALWKLIALGDRQAAQFYLERKGGWKEQTENTNVNMNMEAKDKETLDKMLDAIVKVKRVAANSD